MNENLADEIRKTIESVKDMKIQVGGINNYLSTLENLVRNDITDQVDEAYRKGLDDAWEAAKKIVLNPDEGGTNLPDLFAIFGNSSMQNVFRNYSASQVIAKLEAYEEKQKAEPNKGKWKNIVEGIEYAFGTCDTCGARIPMVYKYYEFCPHCGKLMKN